VQCNALRQLIAAPRKPAFARQPHGIEACTRRIVAAGLRDPLGLARKRSESAKCCGIDRLHEHRCPPALLGIGTAESCEPAGQHLDYQCERVALMAGVDTAGGKYRAGRL